MFDHCVALLHPHCGAAVVPAIRSSTAASWLQMLAGVSPTTLPDILHQREVSHVHYKYVCPQEVVNLLRNRVSFAG